MLRKRDRTAYTRYYNTIKLLDGTDNYVKEGTAQKRKSAQINLWLI